MPKSYLCLGSNLGNRQEYIESAIKQINTADGIEVTAISKLYETEPEGGRRQPQYFNQVIEVNTVLEPEDLFHTLMHIEKSLGRTKKGDYSPRTIDIDILLYGDEVVITDEITIPHPLLHERVFVLKPLSDIAPDMRHPILGKSVKELLNHRMTHAS